MRKRGSQVGFVLSFVIFVTFIFFLFIIVKPSLKTSTSNNLPQNLAGRIIDAASANITTISVSFNKSDPESCLQMQNFFSNTGAGANLTAGDENGGIPALQISNKGTDLYITKNASASFVKIYDSSEFPRTTIGNLGGCKLVSEGSGYSLGLIKTDKEIFISKIIDLIGNYTANYDGFKDYLKVPKSNDFAFSFLYNNGTVLNTPGTRAANVNIYAYETPIQYMTSGGKVESGFINVRTW